MYLANKIPGKAIIIAGLLSTVLLACQKEVNSTKQVEQTAVTQTQAAVVQPTLQLSTATIRLDESNANQTAISLHWSAFQYKQGETKDYRIEASIAGLQSNGWFEIGSTDQLSKDFTVQEFNLVIRKLFVTGFAEDISIRIKCNRLNLDPVSSFSESLQVTTYQPTITYDNAHRFRLPGNSENWKMDSAQSIISPKLDGEYEGYINFTNVNSQFLMIKTDAAWNNLTTYYSIGGGKFGFGGNMFSIIGGAGIYKFNASTNTDKCSYTKINSWSVNGTAVTTDGNTDVEMKFNPYNNAYEIRGNFSKGSFIFRANKNDAIVFGHNPLSEIGATNYNGAKIELARDGNYTIGLSLLSAGNYSYAVQKNS